MLVDFLDFLTFPCYKEPNDISLSQLMSAFVHFQRTVNRLRRNCIKYIDIR